MSATVDSPIPASPTLAASQASRDPLVQLLERMERHSNNVPEESRGMSEEIARLLERAREPGATQDPVLRTQIAYALQDWTKFSGSRMQIVLSPALEAELPQLARAYPGLENTRIQTLVAGTKALNDRELISDIRSAAAEVAGLGTGHRQLGLLASEAAKVLEYRVLARARPDHSNQSDPSVQADGGGSVPPAHHMERPVASPEVPPAAPERPALAAVGSAEARSLNDSRPGTHAERPAEAGGPVPQDVQTAGPRGPMRGTMAATANGPAGAGVTSAASGILAERVGQLGRRLAEDKVKSATEVVLDAGTAAVDALDRFTTGVGREFANKLDAAARHEPGGVADVIANMTPQGRYSGLHREFTEKLAADPAFASAYDELSRATDRYFRKRQQAQQTARDRGIDYTATDAEAQKADAKIGEIASHIPGREPGKSVLQELGNRAVELYNAAVQGLKALFGRDAGPEARPRPGPSPS